MRIGHTGILLLAVFSLATSGCATRLSPEAVRNEIRRQTGAAPDRTFEFELGGATMRLAKTIVSSAAGEPAGFGALSRIELAVYDVAPGTTLDATGVATRGWDRVVQTRDGDGSLLVLVRTEGSGIADLAILASGDHQVLYGRLRGRIDPSVPRSLQQTLSQQGFQGLKRDLFSAAGEDAVTH